MPLFTIKPTDQLFERFMNTNLIIKQTAPKPTASKKP